MMPTSSNGRHRRVKVPLTPVLLTNLKERSLLLALLSLSLSALLRGGFEGGGGDTRISKRRRVTEAGGARRIFICKIAQ